MLSLLSEELQVRSEGWAATARGHRDDQERYGPTSPDSRDQETHIFQVRLIIKKASPGRAQQRIGPQATPIQTG